ncbi:unnamed protein product [Oppiella nova]|uniref:N-acetyltransferase domain-containing protein n=1 Tax=Oppiella nova TaxID=334625 RepID=A0A7R9QL79_9ACAR|nr:unnamed protein product [Oppiella nova]CAG2167214.1 unnamed protein product [Oppiella nova]
MFTIREGRPEDCQQIAQLFRGLADYSKRPPDHPMAGPDQLEADSFGDPTDRQFRTFVAHLNDNDKQLIGVALYYPKYSGWTGRGVWLEDLYVTPEYRGTGVGLALMARVAKQTVLEGSNRLEWGCLAWNEKSISFYKKLGAINLSDTHLKIQEFRLDSKQLKQMADRCLQEIQKPMFTIREGHREDCKQMPLLLAESAAYHRLSPEQVVGHKQLEVDGFGDPTDRQFRAFVAHLNDNDKQLIGLVFYYPKYAASSARGVWMENLYVKQEYRGIGVGVALMARIAKQAIMNGCQRFEWDCLSWNDRSISFYNKVGATDLTNGDDQGIIFRLDGNQLLQLADLCPHN